MNRIRKLRNDKHLTQDELGVILNVQKSAVSKYELGRSIPSPDVLRKLSEFFNVSIDYILGNDQQTINSPVSKKPKKLLDLIAQEEYTLNGQVATPEDREKIARVIEALFYDAKDKNKRK